MIWFLQGNQDFLGYGYETVIGYVLSAVILCLLCACKSGNQIQADRKTFLVVFELDCADVYAIHYEYYLDEEPIGGGEVRSVDGTALSSDKRITKDLSLKIFRAMRIFRG